MSLIMLKKQLGKLKNKLGKLLFAMGSAPMGVACLLWLPLWFVLDNFLIAAMLALFISFLLSMSVSLYRLNAEKQETEKQGIELQGEVKEVEAQEVEVKR